MSTTSKQQLEQSLRDLARSNASLPVVVTQLRQIRMAGLTREEAEAVLQDLREETTDEVLDDRLLEILDFVTGFCSPHMRVWDERMISRHALASGSWEHSREPGASAPRLMNDPG